MPEQPGRRTRWVFRGRTQNGTSLLQSHIAIAHPAYAHGAQPSKPAEYGDLFAMPRGFENGLSFERCHQLAIGG